MDECSTLHESTEDHGRRAPASRSAEGASERLCRYITRHPLAQDRLELRPDGKLVLTLKSFWKDGIRAILLEPRHLIIRLIAAIPPPRFHLARYLGALSSHSKLRSEVVPKPPQDSAAFKPPPASGGQLEFPKLNAQPDDARPSRKRWAWLLAHVFRADLDTCSSTSSHATTGFVREAPAQVLLRV